MQLATKLRTRLLLILSGVLFAISFPPFGLLGGFAAFLAIVPLLVALEDTTRLRNAFTRGYLAMFVLTLAATYWVGGWKGEGSVDPFLMVAGIALDFIHPIFLIVPVLLYDVTRRRFGRIAALVALPIYWIGFEYWHSTGDFAFPWLSLYNTQTYNTAYIQFIEFTGSYGLSLVILIVNILLYVTIRFNVIFGKPVATAAAMTGMKKHAKAICLSVVGMLILLPYLYGIWALSGIPTTEPKSYPRWIGVTIIQPNINPWDKWSTGTQAITDSMERATRSALRDSSIRSDLILWPETAITYPITLPWRKNDLRDLYHFVDQIGKPILTGIPDREEYFKGKDSIPDDAKKSGDPSLFHRDWNSAMLFGKDLSGKFYYQRYHKQKLVPFGEAVPFVEELPFLGDLFQWGVGLGSWNHGQGYDFFRMPFVGQLRTAPDTAKICTMICYESVYPSYVREFVRSGAEIIAVITNDGWYGKSSGPYQHNRFAILRAVENRRWIIRSANTGISSVIDDKGRIVEERPLFESASITRKIPLLREETLYTRLGDFIALPCEWASGGMTLMFIFLRLKRKKK
ncbi:MAG: apolipoprotein N-acyltransferase [Bacteroidota bacterium]|nr:apolipoprotein N-acyltransferase [Bacteroidota bacterium]MDP4229181.1 apolipoprotein N-acyltransferase [Bacteroidota bacterium]MDP4235507.1 apolipoprotein N-acyltransferase [Bacteroidota bacterium]